MSTITTTQAREYLETIPADKWTRNNKGCALYLLHQHFYPEDRRFSAIASSMMEGIQNLYYRSKEFLTTKGFNFFTILHINDGDEEIKKLYPQSSVKDRVIMLLSDMIAAGY